MDKIIQPARGGGRAGRFFDDGDFTADHDAINAWVMLGGWKKIAAAIYPQFEFFTGVYKGEPPLEGYPTVYPDGLVADLYGFNDHRSSPVVFSVTESGYYRTNAKFRCGQGGCSTAVILQGDGAWDESSAKKEIAEGLPSWPGTSPAAWQTWRAGIASDLHWANYCARALNGLCIEIKGAIPTFGDVLRQMNIYRARLNGTRTMVLVTPERRHDAVFIDQKVFVIHPADLGYEE